MPEQSLCIHRLQLSHCMAFALPFTALLHMPQGNLGVLGPGLGCMSPHNISNRQKVVTKHSRSPVVLLAPLGAWISSGRVAAPLGSADLAPLGAWSAESRLVLYDVDMLFFMLSLKVPGIVV